MGVDSRAQPDMASANARDQLAVVAFPYRERSDMTTGGADRTRRLPDNFAWEKKRPVGSRSSQWAAYVEFSKQERLAIVSVSERQMLAYVRWLAMEREAVRRSVATKSLLQYLSAIRVVSCAIFTPDMPSEDRPLPCRFSKRLSGCMRSGRPNRSRSGPIAAGYR
jgi:hypothetical protein